MSEPNVYQIADQQVEYVEKWHDGLDTELGHDLDGLAGIVINQMRFNYRLWHEEDEARRTDVGDSIIAQTKRSIDGFNQLRNDAIEIIDEYIINELLNDSVRTDDDAALNTETPGSAFDRLSIAALRIYHLKEDLERDEVDEAHRRKVEERLQKTIAQREDLKAALALLLKEIYQGSKRLNIYRQFKMYNDPDLNPAVYGKKK